MKICSTDELAEELRSRITGDEQITGGVVTTRFVTPPQSVFSVETIEGKRFLVAVTEVLEVTDRAASGRPRAGIVSLDDDAAAEMGEAMVQEAAWAAGREATAQELEIGAELGVARAREARAIEP